MRCFSCIDADDDKHVLIVVSPSVFSQLQNLSLLLLLMKMNEMAVGVLFLARDDEETPGSSFDDTVCPPQEGSFSEYLRPPQEPTLVTK